MSRISRAWYPGGDAARRPDSTCSWSAAAPPGWRPPSPPSARARAVALATKGSIQANNSSKAQGGIQASFGEDDSPELHAEDVMRSSHDTANRALVAVLTGDAQSAIHWLEELGCEFTRENGGYRLARCGGASRKRLLQVGDRTGHAITKALREAHEGGSATTFTDHALTRARAGRGRAGGRRSTSRTASSSTIDAGTVVLAAGGRCYAEASAATSSPRTTRTRPVR